jgi:hydroxyethylthiazole kinase-like uncharacterized protein yjeF
MEDARESVRDRVRRGRLRLGAMTGSPDDRRGRVAPLPANDPELFELGLRELRRRWADRAALPPMSAEAMTGADRRAQAVGIPEERLMENAGTAVAAAVRALAVDLDRWGHGPVVILCGPGNNGGDGFVAARRLALAGCDVVVVLVASENRPRGATSARNWDRIARDPRIRIIHTPVAREVAILGQGIDKASVVVDALLGTGVSGVLREPVRTAVEVIQRAGDDGVIRSGGPGRPDRHVPPSKDRAVVEAGSGPRGQGPRGAHRDPCRGRSWLRIPARPSPAWPGCSSSGLPWWRSSPLRSC